MKITLTIEADDPETLSAHLLLWLKDQSATLLDLTVQRPVQSTANTLEIRSTTARKILDALSDGSEMTAKQLHETIGGAQSGIAQTLQRLKAERLVVDDGKKINRRYSIAG